MTHPLLNTKHPLEFIKDEVLGCTGYTLAANTKLSQSPMIADAQTIAHDIVEHLTPFDGTFENELCALGATCALYNWGGSDRLGNSSLEYSIGRAELYRLFVHWYNAGRRNLKMPDENYDYGLGYVADAFEKEATELVMHDLELDAAPEAEIKYFASVALAWLEYGNEKSEERDSYPAESWCIFDAIQKALLKLDITSGEYLGPLVVEIDGEGQVSISGAF